MPIHRLSEKPRIKGTLADITCDSDGKIDHFINPKKAKNLLELHTYNSSEPYYLGMFLVGAYQEIMGNLHNLFGNTNVAHIQLDNNSYQVKSVVEGDRIEDVLNCVEYDSKSLIETMRDHTEKALQNKTITLKEARKLLQNYVNTLNNSTYLKVEQK